MKRTNHMKYLENMDQISSDMMERVLTTAEQYQPSQYTEKDVKAVLCKDTINIEEFGVLLSSAAESFLEEMAERSKEKTGRHFGNAVSMFTPLYLANYCENHCVYCGFHCKNKIQRGKLTYEEIEHELQVISKTGLKEILLLTGECRSQSSVEYIGEAVKLAKKYFTTIGIEIYPLNVKEYAYLQQCGADFVSVYQETYQTDIYEKMHISGPKRVFPYRFYAQERAVLGGMRGVSFGSLLGLGDFRKDAFAAGIHGNILQKKYPHTEIAFSFPRLRPYQNQNEQNSNQVHEKQLLQVILAYRLFMPFAGITISTREREGFRNHIIGLAATKISAGVKVGVGGHDDSEGAKGDEQFEISDARSVQEVHNMILSRGLQPVYTDYIRV